MSTKKMVREIREEFRLPPYFTDKQIEVLVKESVAFFRLLGEVNILDDSTVWTLVKNRVFYAYNNRIADYQDDFASMILTWQMSQVGVSNYEES